jgi:hypothetical protein
MLQCSHVLVLGVVPRLPRVRTTVVGSRQQMCLNEQVLRMPAASGNAACRALVQRQACKW